MEQLKLHWIHALEKVFPDEAPDETPYRSATALRGELFHVQLAYFLPEAGFIDRFRVEIDSPLREAINAFEVRCVPVMLASYPFGDDDFLRKTPGLYPDLLVPCDGTAPAVGGQWRSLFFECAVPDECPAGEYPVTVTMTHVDNPDVTASATFVLTVIPAHLPKQTLIHTGWFHGDSIARYYDIEVFSEKYWEYTENYMKQAARYGINMILTPLFTPPLDTEIGKERLTVQLVDVEKTGGVYRFGFEKLDRFIDMAQNAGMEYFEFSHLFTQWGAYHAAKVMATVDGSYQRVFGWETDASSPEYRDFLGAFLPELKHFMQDKGLWERCFFHVSDEPSEEQMASYRAARDTVAEILPDAELLDAVSHYEYYESGLVRVPVASISVADDFIRKGVERRWTYYCCGDIKDVSNRMLAMPSARNRILGMQLFRFRMEGFLQWGYNFWFSRFSRRLINPFACTDAEEAFPAGDAFLVYPGHGGRPLASLHQLVFADGLQDMRALQLLGSLTSFEEATALLDGFMGDDFDFRHYPHDAGTLLAAREAVNRKIASLVGADGASGR